MKKLMAIICIIGMAFGLVACGSKLNSEFDEAKLKVSAEEVLKNLNDKEYDKITAKVVEGTKDKISPEVLKGAWEPISEKLGDYDSISKEVVSGKDNTASVVIVAKYENSKMQLSVNYNTDMEIIGLFLK